MSSPGRRIREKRERLGMSQAELGGESYTASYISHLEHDRRRPSAEILDYLAVRLDVNVSDLQVDEPFVPTDRAVETAVAHLDTLETILDRDFAIASDHAKADIDRSVPRSADWSTMYLNAQALRQAGDYERLQRAALALVAHPLSQAADSLLASALALHAIALRALGDLTASLEASEDAVAAAKRAGDPSIIARAQIAHVAALGELGHTDELSSQIDELAAMLEAIPSLQLRGRVAATIGNAQFLLDRPEAALASHDKAAEWLSPEADVRAWSRFHKASASKRLAAGIEEGVDQLLDRASLGLQLVGNEADLDELELVRAEHLLRSDPARAASLVEDVLADTKLPAQALAGAYEILARASELTDSSSQAHERWTTAADLYQEAGAVEKAIVIWRRLAERD